MDDVKIRLTIDVTYIRGDVSTNAIEKQLWRAAEHLADNGLLSGDLEANVYECSHSTEVL